MAFLFQSFWWENLGADLDPLHPPNRVRPCDTSEVSLIQILSIHLRGQPQSGSKSDSQDSS